MINGKETAAAILREVAQDVERFVKEYEQPRLAVVIVGDDPASHSYVHSKVKACERCGIGSIHIELPASTSEEELLERVDGLNGDSSVHGILVQLPLPPQIDQQHIIERISPDKDVDGFHPYNMGRLAADKPRFVPCTPQGIIELLDRYDVETAGKRAVIVGRSIIVGKPLALLLSMKGGHGNATVTIAHSKTVDLAAVTREADILVAAVGQPKVITADMVMEGAVVIDVGTNRITDPSAKKGYRWVGDVDFDAVVQKVSRITPVPGGVGPMTIAMLMKNTLTAAQWAQRAIDEQ
ncbi:MAG: bifunctional methylenetetrahydrofolate dehydrogenase/methenyltetrahydrofolate cyclohydrolase FolD [bacterium]|nr:MAG: bifunctional methylenetetrahydrofolate dehydrogenase/methenyltetrahydrofolate cyclohydrolase FolD [bacterium]